MGAGGARLATGWLELTVSTAGAQKQIASEVGQTASKTGDQAGHSLGSNLLGGLKKYAAPLAALAAGMSVKKVVSDSTKAFNDLAAQTNSFQRIMGGTKTQVSGLAGAMQLAGVPTDKVSGSLTIFAKSLGNAASNASKASQMQKKLGGSFLDAAGQVKPMAEILPGLADKFKALPDGAEKTALATQLFGRSGTQMLPFLNKGAEGIAQLTDKAGKMGLVLDDVSGNIFGKAKASAREYDMSIQGLKVQLGQNLVPVISSLQNIYRSALIPVIQSASGWFNNHRDTVLKSAEGIQKYADGVRGAVEGIFSAINGEKIDASSLGPFSAMQSGLQAFGQVIGQQVLPMVRTVFGAFREVFRSLGPVFGQVLPPLLQVVQAFSPLGLLLKALMPIFPQLADVVAQLAQTLGGALGSALSSIARVLAPLAQLLVGELSKAFMQLVPLVAHIASTLGGQLASVLTTLAPLIGQVASVLGQTLISAIQTLMPILPVLVQLVTQVASVAMAFLPSLLGVVQQLVPVVTSVVSTLANALLSTLQALMPIFPVIIDLIAAILEAAMSLMPAILGIVEALLPLIPPLVDLIATVLPPLIALLTSTLLPILRMFSPIIKSIASVISSVLSAIMPSIKAAVKVITDVLNIVIGILTGDWSRAWKGISSLIGDVWNLVVSLVKGGVGIVVAIIVGFLKNVAAVWNVAWGTIGNFFSGIWGGIVNAASGAISGLLGLVSGIKDKVLGALSGAGQWLVDAGKNIVQGLLNGVKKLAGTVGSFFLKLLPGWIVGPFKAALGINSPSKVFHALGLALPAGLTGGVQDGTAGPVKAVKGMAAAVVRAGRFGIDMTASAQQLAGTVGGGMSAPMVYIKEMVAANPEEATRALTKRLRLANALNGVGTVVA